jgi:hypothetical protein
MGANSINIPIRMKAKPIIDPSVRMMIFLTFIVETLVMYSALLIGCRNEIKQLAIKLLSEPNTLLCLRLHSQSLEDEAQKLLFWI